MMVTGSYPPDVCGVGDYSRRLVEALRAKGAEVEVFRQGDIENLEKVVRLSKTKNVVTHIQYPAIGYGWGLSAQKLAFISNPCIVTIHEFSQARLPRKLAELPLAFCADKIIFTNSFEKQSVERWLPGIGKKSTLIPISSNIAREASDSGKLQRAGLMFFGLIRPGKGLEEFLESARILQQLKCTMPIRIVGAIPIGQESYFENMKALSSDVDVQWCLNLSEQDVSKKMLESKYAYLSFPDGVSERRGSFLAALFHELIIVSNSGPMTPLEFKSSFIDVDSAAGAARALIALEKGEMTPSKISSEVWEKYSWDRIAEDHIRLYQSVCDIGAFK